MEQRLYLLHPPLLFFTEGSLKYVSDLKRVNSLLIHVVPAQSDFRELLINSPRTFDDLKRGKKLVIYG